MRALLAVFFLCYAAWGHQYRIEIQSDSALNVRGVARPVWRNESDQPTAEIALRCSGTIKDGTRLRMKGASLMLHQRVSPGASVTVQIQFEAHSREVYGYRLLSGSWYPSAIPYRNGAYDTNQQGVDEYEAIATAPASLTLASAGELAESRSPSAGQQRRRWRLPHAANFTASTLRL